MTVVFTGDPRTIGAACAEAQAKIDGIQGKQVRLRLTKMQVLHLYALGHIDAHGRRLVDMDVLLEALKRYREKR